MLVTPNCNHQHTGLLVRVRCLFLHSNNHIGASDLMMMMMMMMMMISFIQRYSSLSSRLIALLSRVILNDCGLFSSFFIARFEYPQKVAFFQRCLVLAWLVPRETAALSARSLYTMQPCTKSRHFMQSYIRRVYVCLAVTQLPPALLAE